MPQYYLVDTASRTVVMKTGLAILAVPSGLHLVTQDENVRAEDGIYDPRLDRVVEKTTELKEQQQLEVRRAGIAAERSALAQAAALAEMINRVSDEPTRAVLLEMSRRLNLI